MREMKFRVWDKINKVMISFTDLPFELGDCTLQELFEIILSGFSDRYIVMQYIGRHDKKNVEIYEKDILSREDTRNAVVVWDNECEGYLFTYTKKLKETKVRFDKKEEKFIEYETHVRQFIGEEDEVIGNTIENPELMEEIK